jgi:hypothetical protein
MKHFVFWAPEADERLQALILGDDANGYVVRAVREIDFWLARGPLDFGESRYDTVRLGFVPPIAVLFDVLTDPPTAIVLDLWRIDDA